MSIMGEPITTFAPIEKIPGVKPPLGLETRPAAAPKLSPIQAAVLDELRRIEDPRECEDITRAIRSSLPGIMFEEVAEALGDLFDLGLAYRPAKGKWLAKVMVEYTDPAPSRPPLTLASAPTIAQERPAPAVVPKPVQEATTPGRETVRARLQAAAPNVGAEVALADVFPDREERARVKREIHEWTEFRTETRVVPGQKGTRRFATRVMVNGNQGGPVGAGQPSARPQLSPSATDGPKPAAAATREEPATQPAQRVEGPSFPTQPATMPVAPDVQRLMARAAQERDDAVRAAHERYAARVDAINWLSAAIGGAA